MPPKQLKSRAVLALAADQRQSQPQRQPPQERPLPTTNSPIATRTRNRSHRQTYEEGSSGRRAERRSRSPPQQRTPFHGSRSHASRRSLRERSAEGHSNVRRGSRSRNDAKRSRRDDVGGGKEEGEIDHGRAAQKRGRPRSSSPPPGRRSPSTSSSASSSSSSSSSTSKSSSISEDAAHHGDAAEGVVSSFPPEEALEEVAEVFVENNPQFTFAEEHARQIQRIVEDRLYFVYNHMCKRRDVHIRIACTSRDQKRVLVLSASPVAMNAMNVPTGDVGCDNERAQGVREDIVSATYNVYVAVNSERFAPLVGRRVVQQSSAPPRQ